MTMRGNRWIVVTGLLALSMMGAQDLAAQRARPGARAAPAPQAVPAVGIHFIAADPVGDFGQLVDDGFGLEVDGRFPLTRDGALAIRLDGGFLIYGHERQAVCFPVPIGCRIGAELTTTNNIAFLGVGPELAGRGRVSPYLNGGVGLSYFSTQSNLSGLDEAESHFDTRHYSDLVTTLRAGGGVRVQVGSTSRGPIQLDVGASYHRNGVAEYLRKGDIVDHPDGSIEIFPNRTEANLVAFRVGVSFGVGAKVDEDHPGHRRRR
jgi:hypothetical protein